LKEKAKEQFEAVKAKSTELLQECKDKCSETFSELKEKATDIKEKAEEKVGGVKEKFETVKAKSTEVLQECKDICSEKFLELKEKATDIKEKAEEKVGDVKEKITETSERAKDVWDEKKMEMKEKWVEKKEQIKKALSDMKGVAETAFERVFSLRELTDHIKLNDDEKLTLLVLERRLGKSGMLTIGEFIDYYGPQTETYFTLTPAEKEVVDKITDYFLSLREKPFVDEFKKNIGADKTWREKLVETVDDVKEKTEHLKDSFKQSIGVSKSKDSSQRKVEL